MVPYVDKIHWLILGIVLAGGLISYARSRGFLTEKKLLAIALLIAAAIYVLFSIIWGDPKWIIIELSGTLLYGLFYWLALHRSFYLLAIGWALHPAWDIFLHLEGPAKPIAPEWYAVACISFDLLVAGYIVYRIPQWKECGVT